MAPIKYLQIDAISVCFSAAHIIRALKDIVKVNPKKMQCFYNVDPSYFETDPVWWYSNAVQCVRFPVVWADTEEAYRIICLLNGFGQTEFGQLGTIRPCAKKSYNQSVVYIPSVKKTPSIVSDEADDESEIILDFYEDRTPSNPADFVEIIYKTPSPAKVFVNPDDYELYID
jgi:hypothetical protein